MKIETARLVLRPWIEEDRKPFAEMSADPAVMAHLLPPGGSDGASGWIDRQMAHLADHGYCFWALEEKESCTFAGSVGLLNVGYEAHFTPAVEVGWRLARRFWGKGYAPEAARASMRFGFEVLDLSEIVANTAIHNSNSRRVMEKLGMFHVAQGDFDHPLIPEGHPLRRQALYRLLRDRWTAAVRCR